MQYYSTKLKQLFDTVEDLEKAEVEFDKKEEENKKARELKSAEAKEVEAAYKDYLDFCEKANKEAKAKRQEYLNKKKAFIEKYGSYHMTYTNVDGKEEITISDLFEEALRIFPANLRW